MTFKQILLAGAIVVLSATSAQAACSQAQLGTAAKPQQWNIRANAASGDYWDCTFTVRAATDVRGTCYAKNVPQSSITRSASWIKVTSACALTAKFSSPNVIARITSGTLVINGAWLGGINGKSKMDRPASSETFQALGFPLN